MFFYIFVFNVLCAAITFWCMHVEHWFELYILDDLEEKAHPPVPIPEYAHYVNELKENDNEEFEKEYDVSNGNKMKNMFIMRN